MVERYTKQIDNNLIEKLETQLSSFLAIRRISNNQKDISESFYNLADTFYRVIDARNQAIDESLTGNDKKALAGGYCQISVLLNQRVEELLETVSAEIADYAKQAIV